MTAEPETANPALWPLRALPLLLALLGVLSMAGTAAADHVAGSAVDTATPATAGDPALLRSTSRLFGLQAAQPFCKGDDHEDTVAPPSAVGAARLSAGPDTAREEPPAASATAARLRALRDRPQSPRAPPHLA